MQFTYSKPVAVAALILGGTSLFDGKAAIITRTLLFLQSPYGADQQSCNMVEPQCLQNQ
jgi:hypothetical protein